MTVNYRKITVSYNKLFKLLIDKGIRKGELAVITGISPSSVAKLGKGANVNVDVLVRICQELNCTMDDIMEIAPKAADQHNQEQIPSEIVEPCCN